MKEAADMIGREPNSGISVTGPVIIVARTGFTPEPTAMSEDIGVIRTGPKAISMAGTGKRVIVMAAIGQSPDIIAITPGDRRRIRAITDTTGITTGTARTIA